MWNLESYHDILNENNRRHHTIGSWLVVLLVIGVLIVVFA
jgi:hypothetical protein